MGKHQKIRKTPNQKYRLREGSYKRFLSHQINSDGSPILPHESRKTKPLSQNNRGTSVFNTEGDSRSSM